MKVQDIVLLALWSNNGIRCIAMEPIDTDTCSCTATVPTTPAGGCLPTKWMCWALSDPLLSPHQPTRLQQLHLLRPWHPWQILVGALGFCWGC